MTRRARRNHSPAFKAKVALAAVKGEKTLAELAPQTLYFLAVACNGAPTLKGVPNGGGALSEPLVGVPNYTANATRITASWTFTSGGLPTVFGNGTITSGAGAIPNVYAGPGP